MELTDSDRAAIVEIVGPRENASLRAILEDSVEHGYRAGLAAGLERAAQACDEQEKRAKHNLGRANGCWDCAIAIRALARERG